MLHLIALAFLGMAGTQPPPAAATQWTLDKGWLTARDMTPSRDGVTTLIQPGDGLAAAVEVDGGPFPSTVSPDLRQDAGALEAAYKEDKGELVDRYEPFPALGRDAWLRTLTYTNRSKVSQDLTGARMRLAPARMAAGASWHPSWFWMTEAATGRAVCLSYRGSTDYYRIDDSDKTVGHFVSACWRLAPGQQAVIGAQGIWLGKAEREAFRAEARHWYEAINLRVPADTPAWLYDTILYECSAGGHIDSRFSDVGGFSALGHQVDYLADLGITDVWLQAIHKHKTPPDPVRGGWNFYDPLDVLAVDTILGGPEALKQLTADFRRRNLRVIGELVPHGGHSVQALALPQWWTAGQDGKPQRNWGGCAMDYSSPEWQSVMRDVSAWLARDFGMMGARIDVADGSGPHWTSPRTNHASYSTLGGAVEMLRAIHDGFTKEGVAPFILPENANYPEHFSVTALGYGHSTWMMFARELPPLKDEPVRMVARLRDFFENERGNYPPGSRILRTLNNHDSVCETGRVQYRYGAGLARALYGVCLMVEGVPMLYQEEEVGSFDALRTLNLARRSIPEFAHGSPDYLSVDFAPEVFTCLRNGDGIQALGLSNLSGNTRLGRVTLPVNLPDATPVFDAVSGLKTEIKDGAFDWTLAPYATALLRIGQPPVSVSTEQPPRQEASGQSKDTVIETSPSEITAQWGPMICRVRAGAGEIVAHRQGNKVDVVVRPGEATPEMTVVNAKDWKVSGQTALLGDRVIRRHFPFPAETNYAWNRTLPWGLVPPYGGILPAGRLWQSLLEPLHPQRPAVAFEANGQALLISDIESTAGNIVLTDRTDEANAEPYGLALRFHADDQDLTPRIRALGLGQPWEMDSYPERAATPQSLRFTLTLTTAHDVDAALEAERLPVERGEARVRYEGSDIRSEGSTHWFVKPGKVEWSHLAPVPGRRRIRFELRHSEVSAQGVDLDNAYEVRVNGDVVPLEWIQRNTFNTGNAYFGYALTPPLDTASVRQLSVAGRQAWCAQRGSLHVLSVQE